MMKFRRLIYESFLEIKENEEKEVTFILTINNNNIILAGTIEIEDILKSLDNL